MAVEIPADCTCGTARLCPLHFVAEDFFPGAVVYVNPFTVAKYGDMEEHEAEIRKLKLGVPYRVNRVAPYPPSEHYQGNLMVWLEHNRELYHHGCFLPDKFLSLAARAIKEHDAHS